MQESVEARQGNIMDIFSVVTHKLYDERLLILFASSLYALFVILRRIHQTWRIRHRYTDIQSLPRHPVWGNLVNCGERLRPSLERHPDYGFEEIWNEMGQPSCFLMDLAPVDRAFLIIAEPQIVEAMVQPSDQFKYSVPKSDTYQHLKRLIGTESLITQEGEDWKHLRKRFNPGFAPKYLHSLAGSVVSKTQMFVERLSQASASGATITLADYAKDLTTDIITQLTIERDLHAQSTPENQGEKSLFGLLTASRRLSDLVFQTGKGFQPLHYLDPIRPLKARFYEQIFDRKLSKIVQAQMNDLQTDKSATSARTIAQLAISGVPPSKELVRNTVHQIKSFLFAGQDTTAVLILWMCYEMSKSKHSPKHAQILDRLRAEHDAVFGAEDPLSALKVLSVEGVAEAILGSRLLYTTAFVRETLRLHPPAATARLIPEADGSTPAFEIEIDGKMTTVDGLRVYPSQWLIHRNPKVWGGDAVVFNPDRWLDEAYMAQLPTGSWRPFERGPRNCIGQELALMEAKVVLASIARAFDFEKVGLTGLEVEGKLEKEVWNTHMVTAVPVDGMRMRVNKAHRRE